MAHSPIIAETGPGFRTAVTVRNHALTIDEPVELGGGDAGATPVELLLASLASCTTITVRMYADRKGYPLRSVRVTATRPEAPPGPIPELSLQLTLEGELDDEQRRRLIEIAHRCPVHRTLAAGCRITMTA
ncbi:MAG: OsmC family protein [Phycisphaeraceae bacterium]|nr:OsmC family protein [Phycisphaeraceae bacterium]